MFHPEPLSADMRRLITTPPLADTMLPRPRLSPDGGFPRITAVWASPGAGKTTLLTQWAADLEREGPLGWVSVPPASVRRPSLRRLMGAALSWKGSDSNFASDSHESRSPLTLIFDDLHRLRNRSEAEWLLELCRSSVPDLRLILAGRYPPPRLAALPLVQDLRELRSRDLAFTDDETALFLESRGIHFGQSDLQAVHQRTGGWSAALVLLVGWVKYSGQDVGLPENFGGDNRAVADYLVHEVLSRISVANRDFLLTTAVVDSLPVALAVALTGRPDSGAVLAELETNTALVSHTHEIEGVYVYHTVLLSYLRAESRRRNAVAFTDAERAAARWYQSHYRVEAALEMLLRSGATEDILELLQHEGMGLVFAGRGELVHRAIEDLATLNIHTVATHLLDTLMTAPYLPDSVRADYNLLAVEPFIGDAPLELRLVFAALTVLRAAPDVAPGALAALDALELDVRSKENNATRPVLDALIFCSLARALAHRSRGDIEEALKTIRPAVASAHRSPHRRWLDLNLVDAAATLATEAGGWTEAMEFRDLLLADQNSGVRPLDLVSARVELARAIANYQSGTNPSLAELNDISLADSDHLDPGLMVYSSALRLLVLLDDVGDERTHLDELHQLLQTYGHRNPLALAMCADTVMARTLRLHDRPRSHETLNLILSALGADSFEATLATARFHGRGGRMGSAETALERALEEVPRAWNPATLVAGWLLLAGWAEESERTAIADARLLRALTVAEPLQARRPFFSDGLATMGLLESRLGRFGPYERFANSVVEAASNLSRPTGLVHLVELTPKERDILRELPRHQSISDIAHLQQLSPNTIKTHLRSIYQKLDVSGRGAAIARASEQGLL